MIKKICKQCSIEFSSLKEDRNFCSQSCYYKFRSIFYVGEKSARWEGGLCSQDLKCLFCSKLFKGRKGRRFCSGRCSHDYNIKFNLRKGVNSGTWKGGEYLSKYKMIKKPEHKNADCRGYVQEHRLLISEKIGRPLLKGEEVHHINGNKLDNRIENLQLLTKKEHSRITCITRKSFGSSRFKGVYFDKERKKWGAGIVIKGKRLFAKRFDNEKDASEYYKKLAKKFHKA